MFVSLCRGGQKYNLATSLQQAYNSTIGLVDVAIKVDLLEYMQ